MKAAGGAKVLTGTLAVNSAFQAMWGYSQGTRDEKKNKDEMNLQLYKVFDAYDQSTSVDGKEAFYDEFGIQQREFSINDMMEIIGGKPVDGYAIGFELPDLMDTGEFDSVEEAFTFATYLRGLLLEAGNNPWELDKKVNDLYDGIQRGEDLSVLLNENNVGYKTIKLIDASGDDKISFRELENYLKSEREHLDWIFENRYVTPDYKEFVDQRNKDINEREKFWQYYGSADEEKFNKLYPKEVRDKVFGLAFGENSNMYIQDQFRWVIIDENDKLTYDYPMYDIDSDVFKNNFGKQVDATIDAHELNQEIYKPKEVSELDDQLYFQKNKKDVEESGNISTVEIVGNTKSYVVEGIQTAEYNALDTYQRNEELSLKYNAQMKLLGLMDEKLVDIYSAVVYEPETGGNNEFEYISAIPKYSGDITKYSDINYDVLLDNVMANYEKIW